MTGGTFTTDRRGALTVGAGAALVLAHPAVAANAAAKAGLAIGRDQPFDMGWRFQRGAGEGLEASGLDDSAWRSVDLPHDWSIEDVPGGVAPSQIGPFDKHAPGGTATGFTLGGEGWYRKHFRVDGLPAEARVEILFDGVYLESDVWLNGRLIGGNVSGYMPFAYDLTPALLRGGDNVLAVRVRNLGRNSRWYSGSGIYRQVRLDVLPAAANIARWGVAASTRRIDAGVAEVAVSTTLEQAGQGMTLVTRLRDGKGAVVAQARDPASAEVAQTLTVKAAQLWSPDRPALYSLESELRRGDTLLDRIVQPFGLRIITIDPQQGLRINDAPFRLRGGCIHHDNGLLGAAAHPEADARRIRLLKARGYNAIRNSHNPASRSLREACDRLGMLLIEEAFDAWHVAKLPQDFSTQFKDHWQAVIRAMVLSARNSPSVFLWSIGNEIPYRSTDEGVAWSWQLANAIKRIDPTRPVTAGLNGVLGAPMVAAEGTARPGMAGKTDNASTIFLDVPGYNYRLDDIEGEHKDHPDRVVYASETFPKDAYDYQALAERAPYFLGEFVWTAMDYLGEAGCGATAPIKTGLPYYLAGWPWINAWCGDIDLIGEQKPASRYRDVVWGLSPLELAVQRPVPEGKHEFIAAWGWSDELQSWNWPGAEGKPLAVRVYTRGDRVTLLLDGKEIGAKDLGAADKLKAEFNVPFQPGRLEAVAWQNGREIARKALATVGAPARLRLVVEPGGKALHYVKVEVLDAAGHVIPDEARAVTLAIDGPAALAAFGNAGPFATGSFQAPTTLTYHGRALAILRTHRGGAVRIEARSENVRGASVVLRLGRA